MHVDIGKGRKIRRIENLERERGLIAGNERLGFVYLHRNGSIGKAFDDVVEQTFGYDAFAVLVDKRGNGATDRTLGIGSLKFEGCSERFDIYA